MAGHHYRGLLFTGTRLLSSCCLTLTQSKSTQGTMMAGHHYRGLLKKDTKDDWTPLFWAALRGQNVVMKLLLDTGKADVNSRDALGDTPLFWATKTGQSASVTLLLENGALTSIENRCGCSSLQLAVFNKHRGVEQILAMHDAYESADFYGIKMMFDEG
ncbi:ankyrin repeat-containing domain protein [Bisporella sp. PMI_857]|nr:ankyrin repeat-containing domain protein [Bisporella sp. PMI_857]